MFVFPTMTVNTNTPVRVPLRSASLHEHLGAIHIDFNCMATRHEQVARVDVDLFGLT